MIIHGNHQVQSITRKFLNKNHRSTRLCPQLAIDTSSYYCYYRSGLITFPVNYDYWRALHYLLC